MNVEKRILCKKNQSNISDEEYEDNEDIEENKKVNEDEINATIESVNVTVDCVNATIESVNTIMETIKATEKSTNMTKDELTSIESNELNENFTLTDKIFIAVKKIVIVYSFYRLVRWFL